MPVQSRRFTGSLFILAALVAFTAIGCGDDDKGNGSNNGDAGVYGDIEAALTGAQEDVLVANAMIYASTDYFAPRIAAALSSSRLSAGSAQESCLPEAAIGQNFDYIGSAYVGAPDASVPADGVRFQLYEIGQGGTPILSEPIGYLDITCTQEEGLALATIDLVFGDVTVLSIDGELTISSLSLDGAMHGPTGTPTLQLLGVQSIVVPDLTLTFSIPGSFSATYSEESGPSQGGHVTASVIGPYPAVDWELLVSMSLGPLGNITGGYLSYTSESEAGVVACAQSGTVSNPVLSAPSSSCALEEPLLPTTAAERQAMVDGYKALRSLWLTVSGFVELGLSFN